MVAQPSQHVPASDLIHEQLLSPVWHLPWYAALLLATPAHVNGTRAHCVL
jgi:hypothetical protein